MILEKRVDNFWVYIIDKTLKIDKNFKKFDNLEKIDQSLKFLKRLSKQNQKVVENK